MRFARLVSVGAITALSFLGCGEGAGSSTVGPKPTGATISGHVNFTGGGGAAPGTKVQIGDTVVTTDAAGAFTIDGVATPYDVVLLEPPGDDPSFVRVICYRGLTRTDPTLTLDTATANGDGTNRAATVRGHVTGGAGVPIPNSAFTQYGVYGGVRGAGTSQDRATGAYTLEVRWTDAPSAEAKLFALQVQMGAEGRIGAYRGYAERDITVSPGQTLDVDLALEPMPSTNVTGTVHVPTGYYLERRDYALEVGSAADGEKSIVTLEQENADIVAREESLGPAFATSIPRLANATFSISVSAGFQSAVDMLSNGITVTRRGLRTDMADALSIEVPEAPAILEPENESTGVTSATRFRWTASSGLKTLHVMPFGLAPEGGKNISFTIYTCADRTTLPDLSKLGEHLPAGAQFAWNLTDVHEVMSVDEATSGDVNRATDALMQVTTGMSEQMTFTTAE